MFSGKSEELLRRIKRGVIAKQKVLLFKPSIDNRYEENKVSTHNGNSYESVNIDKAEQIYEYINDEKYDIIGIDEVQFFDHKIVEVINKLADNGVRVIVAGLDMDFKAEPFHPMPEIMAISEMVTKLHAVCNKCGKEASRSQRLINGEPAKYDDPIVVIGASESYEARCRHCHEIKR
jgi:thymidine kinase